MFDMHNNINAIILKKMTKENFREHMKKKNNRKSYMVSVKEYEITWDGIPGQVRNVGDKIMLPSFVQSIREVGTEDKTFLGYFWNMDVVAQQKESYTEDEAKRHSNGTMGIFRDRKVIGAIEMSTFEVDKLQAVFCKALEACYSKQHKLYNNFLVQQRPLNSCPPLSHERPSPPTNGCGW